MSNLREKAIKIAKQTSSESAFMCGYDRACQEYEEKLRWIPIDEHFPEVKPFFLKNENKHEGDTHYIEYVGQYDIIHPDDIRKRTHWRSAFL